MPTSAISKAALRYSHYVIHVKAVHVLIRKDWTLLANVSINIFYSYELSVKGSPQKSENVQRPMYTALHAMTQGN